MQTNLKYQLISLVDNNFLIRIQDYLQKFFPLNVYIYRVKGIDDDIIGNE